MYNMYVLYYIKGERTCQEKVGDICLEVIKILVKCDKNYIKFIKF